MSLLLAGGSAPVVDDPEARIVVYGEDWQPEDTYHESVGEIPQYVEEPAAAEDPVAAIWEETPDLAEDSDYVQDQYTEPIGGPETCIAVVEEFHEPEEHDASALADTQEDPPVADDPEARVVVTDDGSEEPYPDIGSTAETQDDSLEGITSLVDDPYEDTEQYDPSFVSDAIDELDIDDSLEGIDALTDAGSEETYPDTGSTSEPWDDALDGIVALVDEPYDDTEQYDPSFVSDHADELDIDDSLEGIDAPTDSGSEEVYPDTGAVVEPWEEPLDGIVAIWDEWEVEIEWGEWSTDFDAEAEPARRPRRPLIRPIKEGQGTTPGVEGQGEVGAPKPHGVVRLPKSEGARARPAGVEGIANVGAPQGRGKAKAVPTEVPESHGECGTPAACGGAHAAPAGVEGVSEYGQCHAYGGGKAAGHSHAGIGIVGTPKARGIRNPTDAEMVAMIIAARRRRRKRLV